MTHRRLPVQTSSLGRESSSSSTKPRARPDKGAGRAASVVHAPVAKTTMRQSAPQDQTTPVPKQAPPTSPDRPRDPTRERQEHTTPAHPPRPRSPSTTPKTWLTMKPTRRLSPCATPATRKTPTPHRAWPSREKQGTPASEMPTYDAPRQSPPQASSPPRTTKSPTPPACVDARVDRPSPRRSGTRPRNQDWLERRPPNHSRAMQSMHTSGVAASRVRCADHHCASPPRRSAQWTLRTSIGVCLFKKCVRAARTARRCCS